jgi:hypothetical protein
MSAFGGKANIASAKSPLPTQSGAARLVGLVKHASSLKFRFFVIANTGWK